MLFCYQKPLKLSFIPSKYGENANFFGDNFSETDCICKFSTIFTKTNLEWSIGIDFECQFIPTDFLEGFEVKRQDKK